MTDHPRIHLAHWRHELRTPLNAVIGYSEMLQEDAEGIAPDTLVHGFRQLHLGGVQLLSLINSSLDAAKHNEGFDFAHVASALWEESEPLLAAIETQNTTLLAQCSALAEEGFHQDLEKIRTSIDRMRSLLENRATPQADATKPSELLAPATIIAEGIVKPEPCHLLVVDDNEANREIFFRQLSREGHQVTTAANGMQALQLLREQTFDIVLLDVLMPGMSGYQVLQQMKADPVWQEVPVIMISALDELEGVVHCLEMGAEDYLSKPFDSVLLRVRINSCLEKKRLRDQLRGQLKAIQNELDIAAGIQQSILPNEFPAFPTVKEFDLFAAMIPAREVGGDFYDFFLIDEERAGLVIGDVSGKGVPAALFMAVTRTLVKSIALTGTPPGQCLEQVNRLLVAENRSFMFVTLFYAILNFRTGELAFSNAGHNPAYRIRAQGEVATFGAQGSLVLGVAEDLRYRTESLQLQCGDTLFFYTDGITEACNNDHEMFTDERLHWCLQNSQAATPEACIQFITGTVREFSGSAPQSDDLTMLAVSYQGQPVTKE